jgi:L-serine/L-threonine ammonia-lyase
VPSQLVGWRQPFSLCLMGNAGYAVAYAGGRLGIPVNVVVPQTTPAWVQDLIRREEATVVVYGNSRDDAHIYATQLAEQGSAAYVDPFDVSRVGRGTPL